MVCAAGLHVSGQDAQLLHLGTHPGREGRGHARALLRAVTDDRKLRRLTAETDGSAAGFYRRCGFELTERPSPWGTPRFLAVWTARP